MRKMRSFSKRMSMRVLQTLLACIGRMCMGALFLLAGISHFLDWNGSVSQLEDALCRMASLPGSMPFVESLVNSALLWTPLLVGISIFCLLLGGFLLFFGMKTRFGAFLLILFLIGSTLVFHAFWTLPLDEKPLQMTMFMKNLAILGGLLTLLAFGNGGSAKKSSPRPKQEE